MNTGFSLATIGLLLVVPTSLRAAEKSTVSDEASVTETIVITLDREATEHSTQPASISVLGADDIERVAAQHPAELVNRVPGIMVQQGSGQEHLTSLRSPVLTGGAGAGSFLYLQDGVPLRSAGFANVNGLFDAQTPFARQIEVVRGPGEVTYGSNAIHGIFNILSLDPLTAGGGSLSLSVAEFDRYGFTWQGGQSDETSGVFAGLSVFHDGGYRDDSGVDQIKGQFGYGYSSADYDLRLRLSVHHLEQETAGFVVGDDAYDDDNLRRTNPNPEAFRDVDHLLLSAAFDVHDWGGWKASITPYARWTDMNFRLHFLPSQALEENDHASLGVLTQFQREIGDGVDLLLGVDWEHSRGSLSENQTRPDIFSFTQGLHYDYRVTATELAPFARLRWQPSDDWMLQAGVRVNHTRYDYDNRTEANIVGRFFRPADRDDNFTTLTSKLAASYQASERDFWFVSLARGGRPPQTTDLYRLQRNQTVADADAETIDSLEFGWRHQANDYRVEIGAYSMRKRNFFFRDADGFNVTDGKTSHQGVELSLDAWLSEHLNWQTSLSYGEHQYRFDRPVNRDTEVISSGDDIDTAPRWLANSRLFWELSNHWQTEFEVVLVDEYYTDAANSNDYPGHTLANWRLYWQPNPQLTVSAALRNISDQRYATRADFAFGNERYFPGEERNWSLSVNYRF